MYYWLNWFPKGAHRFCVSHSVCTFSKPLHSCVSRADGPRMEWVLAVMTTMSRSWTLTAPRATSWTTTPTSLLSHTVSPVLVCLPCLLFLSCEASRRSPAIAGFALHHPCYCSPPTQVVFLAVQAVLKDHDHMNVKKHLLADDRRCYVKLVSNCSESLSVVQD